MKSKGLLFICIMLSALIGWAFGFLRLPYIEQNQSFWVGFITALSLVALVFVFPGNKAKTTGTSARILALLAILIGGGVVGVMLYQKHRSLQAELQQQNKKITELTVLMESHQKSGLSTLLKTLLDEVAEELKQSPNKALSETAIAKIASLSTALQPYGYFEGDTLLEKKVSPERGQLLLALCLMDMDSVSFGKIRERTSFSGADLKSADLHGINLTGIDLSGANLQDAILEEATFSNADLSEANLAGANLNKADLSCADLKRATLSWAQLNNADLSLADLSGAILTNAQLRNAELSGAIVQWAKADGALLDAANLPDADLEGTELAKANLNGANLDRTDLRKTNFSEADVISTALNKAIVEVDWLKKANSWRLKGIEENYSVVNDSTDKWGKPVFRLKRIRP